MAAVTPFGGSPSPTRTIRCTISLNLYQIRRLTDVVVHMGRTRHEQAEPRSNWPLVCDRFRELFHSVLPQSLHDELYNLLKPLEHDFGRRATGVGELSATVTDIAGPSNDRAERVAQASGDAQDQMSHALAAGVKLHPEFFPRQRADGPLNTLCQAEKAASQVFFRFSGEVLHMFPFPAKPAAERPFHLAGGAPVSRQLPESLHAPAVCCSARFGVRPLETHAIAVGVLQGQLPHAVRRDDRGLDGDAVGPKVGIHRIHVGRTEV